MQMGFSFSSHEIERKVDKSSHGSMRDYQKTAESNAWEKLAENRSTLIVQATGTGKTHVFCSMVSNWGKRSFSKELSNRVLVIAHRDELLSQARSRLSRDTDELVGLEQASFHGGGERIVVGSVQTLRGDRLKTWPKNEFGLIIIDEAHHAPAPSYKKILEHFADAKVVGFTATPDRADERAMGQVFDSVAFVYEIEDAIKDGWLCPIVIQNIYINSINLASCGTVAGDFNQADLDAAMVDEALHGIANATLKEAGTRKTIGFATGVVNAQKIAEIMNSLRPNCARSVDAKTPIDTRRAILSGHKRGDFQFLWNVGIATEGYDDPEISCIAQGRPTKSRALLAQMTGRGLRGGSQFPIPGKENLLILEFTGNHGKHKLTSAVDILGGRYEEEEVEIAKLKVKSKSCSDPQEALKQAHEEYEKRKAAEEFRGLRVRAKVDYTTFQYDPFSVLHIKESVNPEWEKRFGGRLISDAQRSALVYNNVPIPPNCTASQASRLIATLKKRKELGLANYSQIAKLQRVGIQAINMTWKHAADLCWEVQCNRGKPIPQSVIDGILSKGREPGEE